MLRYLTAYVCTTTIHFTVDMIWIGYLARDIYRAGMGPIMRDPINIPVAVLFYVIYAIGLVLFAVGPALNSGAWRTALVWGALFGFFTYATYDLTNLATLQQFPATMAMIDLAWGTILSACSATGGFFVARQILSKLGEG
ncbi:MAG: DUF2177 family protein [Rhodospirillaceae bacterium]|nr:MAG: DUF2177 family protein [Rhodospirillaceae bacterium]